MTATTRADPFGEARAAAARLAEISGIDRHDVAVVLGSGWIPAADRMGQVVAEWPMVDLGGFPAPSVAGHHGLVRSIAGATGRILAFVGRAHVYEVHGTAPGVPGVLTARSAG